MAFRLLQNQKLTSKWFAQAIVRRAYPIGAVCTVQRGPLKGIRFKVAPGMGFTYAWGIGVEQYQCAGLVRPGMSVYDIGANCGQSTLSLARLVGASGRVVAFEPVEELFSNLVENKEYNPSLPVTTICAAVSSRNGQMEFYFDGNCPTQGHLAELGHPQSNGKSFFVRAVRLDDYSLENWPVPQFIKIDAEGGAGAVFQGAESLIGQYRPTIYVELHGMGEQEAVRDLLKTFRYKASTVSGLEVPDPTTGWFNPLICRPC